MDYDTFILKKSQMCPDVGFTPVWMPEFLFDFQVFGTDWAIRKGRAALFEDCGLGKTAQELVWAENVVRHTNKPVLILAPLAVSHQTVSEGQKFDIECTRSEDGSLKSKIIVTNYERLDKFSASDFSGIVCDEASILKHFSGATQKQVTRFASKIPYRLMATATPAPNDYTELGSISEALGYVGYSDMLARFFRQTDKSHFRMDEVKLTSVKGWDAHKGNDNGYFAKLAYRAVQQMNQWRLKGHAEVPFWKWVGSWAKACRKPSDLGFPDNGFILPELTEQFHIVAPRSPMPGKLFTIPAVGFHEERQERRWTIQERCEKVAELVDHDQPAIIWCQLNDEADAVEKMIPYSVQVAGRHSDEEKEGRLMAFCRGDIRVLITKAKIAGLGLNMHHCAHVVTFASHSWEQYYQAVRRCWRFGQKRPVQVDIVCSEGEQRVMENMQRKAQAAAVMFENLLKYMNDSEAYKACGESQTLEAPGWLA